MRLALLLVLAGVSLAQTVRLYSEFERIDPFGGIVAADRAEAPREILSPALARNAWTTFQVVVEPADQPFTLYVAQNPERSVEVKLYRPVFARHGEGWVPDGLEPVSVAGNGAAGVLEPQVPGQSVVVYWMDVWVPPDAQVRRTRLEVQVQMGDRWTIYPMETRIHVARPLPSSGRVSRSALPGAAVAAPSSTAALAVVRAYACGTGAAGGEAQPLTVRGLIRRNALQDQALARSLENSLGRARIAGGMLAAIGAKDPRAWCRSPQTPPEFGSEWVLRVRDFLYKSAADVSANALRQ